MQRWLIMDKATPTSLHRKGLNNGPLFYIYVLSSETSTNNGVNCAGSSVEDRRCRHRHRHRQLHGGIRHTEKVLNCGESGNKMSGKIKGGGRSGEYSPSESSPPFCNILHIRSFFLQISPADIGRMLCTATGSEDRTPHQTQLTRTFFSLRTV